MTKDHKVAGHRRPDLAHLDLRQLESPYAHLNLLFRAAEHRGGLLL